MKSAAETPAERGFMFPAEWEPHEATWLAWPHNASDWPGRLTAVRLAFAEIVRRVTESERARVLVNSREQSERAKSLLRRAGADLALIELIRLPTDRAWIRDYGPVFLRGPRRGPEMAVADFAFNGWAQYEDFKRDNAVASRLAGRLGLGRLEARALGRPFVLEGGAVDLNGHGSLLATEQCLLHAGRRSRNPGLGRAEIESALESYLCARCVIWLGRGLTADDTCGHVDMVCRFVARGRVVCCRESNPSAADHRALEENRERLDSARLADGSRLEVIDLPMPAPVRFNGERLAASYANFYLTNAAVLVPTYNDPRDREALGIFGELFPDRSVVGIHSLDLVWGGGAVHCLTREQPSTASASERGPRERSSHER